MRGKGIIALIFVCFLLVGLNSQVKASPYFDAVSFYTEHNTTFEYDWSYQFGLFVYDTEGEDIVSVIAEEVTTGDEFILSEEPTLTGDWIWGSAPITSLPYLDQLEIIAMNSNGEINSILTHVLDNEFRVDIAEGVTMHKASLTPKISWDPVTNAHNYRVRILDEFGTRIFDSILAEGGSFTETSYILPSGVLDYDTNYIARIIANNYGDDGDGNYKLENRSSSYKNFRTAPVPEPCTIDIHPDTLNKKSKGQYITSYIELPETYSVEDIDVETLMLSVNDSTILAELSPTEIGDYNDNGIPDLMVKFDRQSVQDACLAGEVEMAVYCETYNATSFEGTDTVLVIDKGKKHFSEHQGSVVY